MDAPNLLKDTDPEEIEDILPLVERSFSITFQGNDLVNVQTFGQLCAIVMDKMQASPTDDCTSQQAFYKLRDAMATATGVDKTSISPGSALNALFPRHQRRQRVRQVVTTLGFSPGILRPPHLVIGALMVLTLAAIVGVFIRPLVGIPVLTALILAFQVADHYASVLVEATVGQLAARMASEHYRQSRRNPLTANTREVERGIRALFVRRLDLSPDELTADSVFY